MYSIFVLFVTNWYINYCIIYQKDLEGNNALHHGVLGQRHTVVATLLDANFDIELVNFRLFTPVHDAARIGFLSLVYNSFFYLND